MDYWMLINPNNYESIINPNLTFLVLVENHPDLALGDDFDLYPTLPVGIPKSIIFRFWIAINWR